MKLIKDRKVSISSFFPNFQVYHFCKDQSTMDFFPVIKTRLVGVTKMAKTRLSIVADLSQWTLKMLQIKYFLCLRHSVKTSN